MRKKITLTEWAAANGITPAAARNKARRGNIPTAQKIGRDWIVAADAPNLDHRYKVPKEREADEDGEKNT